METSVLVALIAALVSLSLGVLNLINQRRVERLRKTLDFDTLRFERLHDIKQDIVTLADASKHSLKVALEVRDRTLAEDEKLALVMEWQKKQALSVAEARNTFRRNKHLVDVDLRRGLEKLIEDLHESAVAGLNPPGTSAGAALKLRVTALEAFIPECERVLEAQLDRISASLSKP